MLKINGLTKYYGRFLALDHLDLEISKGEIFGFVGPNGAGKTTTMKIVCGLLNPTSGEVFINGVDALKDAQSLKRKIGYVPDFFGVYDNLKAMEYMEFYASMYGLEGKAAKETCLGLMDLVNLSDKTDSYVDGLSRGMKQRLCLARSLVHNPDLLILDEPASGLDPRARFEMKEILKNLKEMGKTIIISSHILPELSEMCTSIGIMKKGRLILRGQVDEILEQAKNANPLRIDLIDKKEEAITFMKENPKVKNLSIRDNSLILAFDGDDMEIFELMKTFVDKQIPIRGIHREEGNLETLFIEVTAEEEK